ncbi:MAG: hypothetical protein A3H69_02445 [Candidatus Sungbacteria bacterium RIFCSPLOWO2_02_FULL_47_9]|uniref:Uncharacterized protein n=1 Tax=Candidatus Sungbacteria bacterium RIFCSPHIGHO2_01_FULL_47_32 TaxID=1802264 RepID=A0A1G2K3J5_9BACT|nr:MAG: hypothetical protein A2633_00950 [Candidatus Sungbacteria bacterium RIFCSPHIGHO2_01_FULL_47_32]OHA11184.1 MAG: hypothetical protein A3H69_02445 [Candidatus Sungbacteria bacterium RIFCSPLOWO2_02_FULL_47_9]
MIFIIQSEPLKSKRLYVFFNTLTYSCYYDIMQLMLEASKASTQGQHSMPRALEQKTAGRRGIARNPRGRYKASGIAHSENTTSTRGRIRTTPKAGTRPRP